MARSLTIVFNVLLGYLYLGTSTSLKTKLCLAVVIVGFFVGTKGEINFSLAGTTSGILSSLFVSMNAIFTKKVLPAVGNDQWRLTFVNNANASIIFLPLIWLFERDVLQEKSAHFGMLIFWASMLLAGVFGFLIGIVTVMQIRATSPLSHNISGKSRERNLLLEQLPPLHSLLISLPMPSYFLLLDTCRHRQGCISIHPGILDMGKYAHRRRNHGHCPRPGRLGNVHIGEASRG